MLDIQSKQNPKELTLNGMYEGRLKQGTFEGSYYRFRLSDSYGNLDLRKEGHSFSITCLRIKDQGLQWENPSNITLNGKTMYSFELPKGTAGKSLLELNEDKEIAKDPVYQAFRFGAETMKRFRKFLKRKFPEVEKECNRDAILVFPGAFAVFDPPNLRKKKLNKRVMSD